MHDRKMQVYIKLKVFYEEPSFGPGIVSLLEGIDKHGSLSASAQEMGMAYSKAWKILKRAQKDLGMQLVVGTVGGRHGGGTSVTAEGRDFVKRYLAFAAAVKKETERLLEEYF